MKLLSLLFSLPLLSALAAPDELPSDAITIYNLSYEAEENSYSRSLPPGSMELYEFRKNIGASRLAGATIIPKVAL